MSSSPPLAVRLRRLAVSVGLVAVGVVIGVVAGRTALVGPEDPLDASDESVSYEVVESTVGRTVSFTAIGEWELELAGRVAHSGLVTTVEVDDGQPVEAGDVLFTVGLRPVVAAEGDVPAFRDLAVGVEGPDVSQLQRLLAGLGHYDGEVDGRFRAATAAAVRSWQRQLEVPVDGVVALGDVVFVSELPARVSLGERIAVGQQVGVGDEAVFTVSDAPRFWIRLGPEQRAHVPPGADVEVRYPEGRWSARIDRVVKSADDRFDLLLAGADDGPVCGDECRSWVTIGEQAEFLADVVVVAETRGPVVPVAAIQTGPDNQAFVTLESGDRRPVDVVVTSSGVAVVDGVDVGTILRLADDPPPDQTAGQSS